MNENEHIESLQDPSDTEIVPRDHRPYWRRAHHSWGFWVGLVLAMAAIIIYFASDNLSMMVQGRAHRSQSSVVGR